jgi:hypothetical protein
MKPKPRMIFNRQLELVYRSDPETPQTIGHYRAQARRIFAKYPHMERMVVVWRPCTPRVRYKPEPGEALYVPSTGGRYGKSCMVRVGGERGVLARAEG